MLAHALNNLVAFLLIGWVDRAAWPAWVQWAIMAGSAGVLVLCVRVLRQPGAAPASEPVAAATLAG